METHMTEDEQARIFNDGFQSGQKHIHPSQETLEMFGKLNVDIAELKGHFNSDTGIIFQILKQTTKTNGSVGKLQTAKNQMAGALLILSIIVIPLLSFYF